MNLTKEDVQNILLLISKAPITGSEAIPVALLVQKLKGLLQPEEKQENKSEE